MTAIRGLTLLFLAAVAIPAQTVVDGITYKLGPGKTGYVPLAGVTVVAIREQAGPAAAHPVTSDADGRFQLTLPEGGPFVVVFYGDMRLPQLQQLAGNKTRNMVHVTLYTPAEYRDLHPGGMTPEQKARCLAGELPEKAEASGLVRKYLDGLFKR
jgi:hypothetical protein